MDGEELQNRLEAHRMAFGALALVISDITPGAIDAIILALGTFESGMRQRNYPAAQIDELRVIRDRMQEIAPEIPTDPFPKRR